MAENRAFAGSSFRKTLSAFDGTVFDRLFFRDIFASLEDIAETVAALKEACTGTPKTERDVAFGEDAAPAKNAPPLIADGAATIISQRIPSHGQHLSPLISVQVLAGSVPDADTALLLDKMAAAEKDFFSDTSNPLFAWNADDIAKAFTEAGFSVETRSMQLEEKRSITEADIGRWFSPSSAYGQKMAAALGTEGTKKLTALLSQAAAKKLFIWNTENVILTCRFGKTGIQ